MTNMPLWQMLLIGVVVVLVLLWMTPGIKASLHSGRKGSAQDWKALLLPLGLVIGFVVLLILMASH